MAEVHYKLTLSNYLEEMDKSIDSEIRTPIKVVDKVTQTVFDEESGALVTDADTGGPINLTSVMAGLDSAELIKFAKQCFSRTCCEKWNQLKSCKLCRTCSTGNEASTREG